MTTWRSAGVLLALLVGSTANAQTASAFASGATNQLITAIRNTSAAQMGSILKNGGSIRTSLQGLGGRIGYGGGAQIGAMAIVAALNHFYETVKDQANPTGTSLDTYYTPVTRFNLCSAYHDANTNRFGWSSHGPSPTQYNTMAQAMNACVGTATASTEAFLQDMYNWFPNGVQRYEWHPQYESATYAQTQMDYYAYPNPTDTLPDFVIGDSDAGDGAKAALEQYLQGQLANNPDALPDGVSVSPAPNANQIAGEAVNPTFDTDRDGYSDAAEIAAGTNPNSALSHPDTAPDTVKDPSSPPPPDPNSTASCLAGSISVTDFVANFGGAIRAVFVPCREHFTALRDAVSNKFPFSIGAGLNNLMSGDAAGNGSEALPTDLGWFHLDFARFSVFFTLSQLLWKTFLSIALAIWLVGKASGQLVIN